MCVWSPPPPARPQHVAPVVDAGGIRMLVAAVKRNSTDEDIQAAITPTLLKLATTSENVAAIARDVRVCGAVRCVWCVCVCVRVYVCVCVCVRVCLCA